MKIGIIDVGGGFRDIYGAGVLDVCMEQGIQFDSCIGISAGSANLASYLSHQPGRSYTFYMEYVFRKEYASLENWLKTRNYVDLDYIYDTLSNSDGENPVDYEAMEKNPAEFLVGACNALTGEPVYFDKSYLRKDHYDIFKASCALPVFCKPYMIGEMPCLDGGISDPIPVDRALADGCDKVVLILTRPVSQRGKEGPRDCRPAFPHLPEGGCMHAHAVQDIQRRRRPCPGAPGAGQGAHHRAGRHLRAFHPHQGP